MLVSLCAGRKEAVDLFQEELLPILGPMAEDPVANVRLALCRLRCSSLGNKSGTLNAPD